MNEQVQDAEYPGRHTTDQQAFGEVASYAADHPEPQADDATDAMRLSACQGYPDLQ